MASRIPPEILVNIVCQVFHHTQHLNTLYSLLCSSRFLFYETARVVYFDPFQTTCLGTDPAAAYHKLVRLILSLSPLEDEPTNTIRALMDIQKIERPTIDYVGLILSDKLNLEGLYAFWHVVRLRELTDFKETDEKARDLCQALPLSFAWTIYGNKLSHFKRISFPSAGIEQLLPHVSQLRRLEFLELDPGCTSAVGTLSKRGQILSDVVSFVHQMQAIHGADQLKDIVWFHPSVPTCHSLLYRELEDLLPPLTQPTVFNPRRDWRALWSRSIDDVDLSCVKKIEAFGEQSSSDRIYDPKHLQRCRSLQFVRRYSRTNPGIFDWAVEERRKHMAVQQQHHDQQEPSAMVGSMLAAGACVDLLPPLVPLRRLAMYDNTHELLESVMYAFNSSLESVQYHIQDSQPILPCGATWRLPRLRRLDVCSEVSGFVLQPGALDHLPKLQSLRLGSGDHVRTTNAIDSLIKQHSIAEPWTRLGNLQTLKLSGFSCVSFDPSSLRWMPQLEVLTVTGPVLKSDFIYPISFVVNNPRQGKEPWRIATPFPNTHLWTWDWEMPCLRHLELRGDPALRFQFQWLKHCPKLEVLILNIWGASRRVTLSDFISIGTHDGKTRGLDLSPLSSTLKEVYLMEGSKNQWYFSNDALEALLQSCGPQLRTLHCYTGELATVEHLGLLAQIKFQQLKQIDINPAIGEAERSRLGFKQVGRMPFGTRSEAPRYQRHMLHRVPRQYHDCQLWFFGKLVYVRNSSGVKSPNEKKTS